MVGVAVVCGREWVVAPLEKLAPHPSPAKTKARENQAIRTQRQPR